MAHQDVLHPAQVPVGWAWVAGSWVAVALVAGVVAVAVEAAVEEAVAGDHQVLMSVAGVVAAVLADGCHVVVGELVVVASAEGLQRLAVLEGQIGGVEEAGPPLALGLLA